MSNKPPVHQVRIGRVVGKVWLNESGDGKSWHNVTLGRLYKDGEDWKTSESFGRDDLPLVMKVADQCHSWIYEQPPAKS